MSPAPLLRERELERLVRAAGDHPAVQNVECLPTHGQPTVLRLRLRPGYPAEEQRLQAYDKRVARWQLIWDREYRSLSASAGSFNLTSWIDSYTRKPIPEADMREWRQWTLARADVDPSSRVLEIGCGTGLLLLALAPRCASYTASDFSAAAVEYVEQQAAAQRLTNVRLLHRPAHELTGIEHGAFDRVILNSVLQFFPGLDYLERVVRAGVAALAPGGAFFIGDVRSLPLQRSFAESVQRAQAAAELPDEELARRVDRQIAQDGELVVDPAFFYDLAARLPDPIDVELQLKRGRARNEMTRFRYDVILRRRAPARPLAIETHGWETVRDLEGARRIAAAARAPLVLRDVPNPRLSIDTGGVEPEDLWGLSELGLDVEVTWAASRRLDRVDVWLRPAGRPRLMPPPPAPPPARLANDPLRTTWQRQLTQELDAAIEHSFGRRMAVTYVFEDHDA